MPEHPPHTERSSVAVLLRMPPDLAQRLRSAAAADGRPTANLAKHLIARGLADREADRG